MFERFLCFHSEKRIQSGAFCLQGLHRRIVARGRACSRVSLRTVTGGLVKDVLPGGVEGSGGKCCLTALTVHLGLPTSPGFFCI